MLSDNSEVWRSALMPPSATVQEVILSLDMTGLQIVLIVTETDQLLGTLTDGDIRRALLRGCSLQDCVIDIIHTTPFVAPPDMSRETVVQLMQANRIHQLPVVDESRKVLGIHFWDDIFSPKKIDNWMLIMAGGKGTRLRPHTENCPKPMLEVGGKPMLQHIIEKAKSNGIFNFLIAIHYLGEMIVDYFGSGEKFGVNIQYLREDKPLGTAGALSLIKHRPELPFIVTNGDVLADVQYTDILDFHRRHSALATMAVRKHEIHNPFGVVKIEGLQIIGFEEKPTYTSYINAGIYVLSPESLDLLLENDHCDMPTLFMRMRTANKLAIVYPMHEQWLDVGRPDDLAKAKGKYAEGEGAA